MKKGKWFYTAQRLFKEWKAINEMTGDCIKQVITQSSLEEQWFLRKKDGSSVNEKYTLHAYKNTDEVYLLPEYGPPVRTYLQHRKDL